jgi:hypothetical protein
VVPDDIIQVGGSSSPAARCSLWWSKTPSPNGKRVGFIGQYERNDEGASRELLEMARRRLTVAGCQTAVGPVDGDTWHRYRFVTERGNRPAFFLEPDNPDCYPQDFLSAGFEPISRYVSAEELDLRRSDPRVKRAERRLAESGVRIRSFDPSRYDLEIDAIYDIACASFDRIVRATAKNDRSRFHTAGRTSGAPCRFRLRNRRSQRYDDADWKDASTCRGAPLCRPWSRHA